MTTVTYRDRVMCSDSAVTCYNTIIGETQKVWKFESGALYGSCGDGDDRGLRKMLAKVKDEDTMPSVHTLEELGGDIEALFVLPDGAVFHIQTGKAAEATKVDAPYHAVGKGRKFALGAFFAGANTVEACRAGIHFDMNSGGLIQTIALTPLPNPFPLFDHLKKGGPLPHSSLDCISDIPRTA